MQYLHTMLRVSDLDSALSFYCGGLGLVETRKYESEKGRFTLVFLAAPDDVDRAKADKAPLIELTYNWPTEDGTTETLTGGRNFGHLAYQVENIYELCTHLQDRGVTILRPPRDGHMAFVRYLSEDVVLCPSEKMGRVSPGRERFRLCGDCALRAGHVYEQKMRRSREALRARPLLRSA